MPVKTKKEHKKRVARRKNIMNQEKKRFEKAQKDYLMKLINEEKEKGLFNNTIDQSFTNQLPTMGLPNKSGLDLGHLEGPKI
jgi:ABC-type Fe3+-citrate transport system substrate-binding protein